MFRPRFVAAAAVAVAALMLSSPRADAGFQVTFYAPGGPAGGITVTDGQLGVDLDPNPNSITIVNLAVGNYTFTISGSVTNTPGGPTLSFVESNNTASGSGAGMIQVVVSANNFTSPVTPPPLVATSGSTFQVLAGTAAGNSFDVSYEAYVDTGNALSTTGVGSLVGSGGAVGIIASSGNVGLNDVQQIQNLGSPYAINYVITAIANNGGNNRITLDGTLSLEPVPAPSGLILLGTAVPVFGLLRRRLRRTEAPTA
jgi:hypothetical protein